MVYVIVYGFLFQCSFLVAYIQI